MMTLKISRLFLSGMLAAGVSLAACDAPADESANAAGSDLPAAESSMPAAADSVEGSMAEDSPGGEAVTESELPPQSDVPPPSRAVFTDADCDFEAWVGQPVDEEAIKATGRPHRILKPGDMMTMDHNPQRINVEHEEGGLIVTRVWCG